MKVKNMLEKKGFWHRIVELSKEGKSSRDVEGCVGEDVDDIVKTIVIKIDNDFKAFCVRKDNLVDYKKLKEHFKTKKMRMANAEEVLKHSTSPPGACCPLLVDCPIYFDPSILELKKVHMGSGSMMHSLEMKTKDLLEIVSPEILDISTEKKIS